MKITFFLSVLASCLAFAGFAKAQNYAINWFTIDGGGGTSSGGAYSLTGTIGQPDAGAMNGGPFTLVGGFWGIVTAIQTPGAPLLSVANVGGTVIVSWPRPAEGFVLEQTGALAAPPAAISWSTVPPASYQTNGTRIFITVPMPTGDQFYRLHRP